MPSLLRASTDALMNEDIDFSETRIISMIDSINTDLSCDKTDLSHVINISSNLSEVIEVQSILECHLRSLDFKHHFNLIFID